MKNIIEHFLKETPVWIEELKKMEMTECPGCGLRPIMLEALVEKVKEIKEKARKYDELCK